MIASLATRNLCLLPIVTVSRQSLSRNTKLI